MQKNGNTDDAAAEGVFFERVGIGQDSGIIIDERDNEEQGQKLHAGKRIKSDIDTQKKRFMGFEGIDTQTEQYQYK